MWCFWRIFGVFFRIWGYTQNWSQFELFHELWKNLKNGTTVFSTERVCFNFLTWNENKSVRIYKFDKHGKLFMLFLQIL